MKMKHMMLLATGAAVMVMLAVPVAARADCDNGGQGVIEYDVYGDWTYDAYWVCNAPSNVFAYDSNMPGDINFWEEYANSLCDGECMAQTGQKPGKPKLPLLLPNTARLAMTQEALVAASD
jgi:hypothetical protein